MLTLSKEKTNIVKLKKVDELPQLLIKENKLLQLLEKREEQRLQIVTPFFEQNNISEEDRTITTLLLLIHNETEQKQLEKKFTDLTKIIVSLKHQEQLNNQLIQQSLQLIQLSLGMMNPTIQNMNYSNKQENKQVNERSMFDSKA